MSNSVLRFIKRLTTDQDFKTLVQNDPNTAFSQFQLSPAEQATLSEFVANPDEFRKSAQAKSPDLAYWF